MAVSTLSFKTTHSQSEIRPVLDEALQRARDFAYTRFTMFAQECQAFEHTYHKGSDQFLQEFEAGALGVIDVPRNSFSRGTHARDENQECKL